MASAILLHINRNISKGSSDLIGDKMVEDLMTKAMEFGENGQRKRVRDNRRRIEKVNVWAPCSRGGGGGIGEKIPYNVMHQNEIKRI